MEQGVPTYEYYFTKTNDSLSNYHAGELPYAYGNLWRHPGLYSEEDYALSETMQQYWVNFAPYFNDKPYFSYWKERFEKLQWVRNPVVHAHPEYVKKEDIEQVQAICLEITECLITKK